MIYLLKAFIKSKVLCVSFGCFLFISPFVDAQDDSLLACRLLSRIANEQIKEDSYFLKGIFPAYISKRKRPSKLKKDNTCFYNSLIVYTLNDLQPFFSVQSKKIADSIRQASKEVYTKFKNKKGRDTYNFWRTDTAFRFPYGGLFRPFLKTNALADDLDDTVLALLALDASDSEASVVHDQMQGYVNSKMKGLDSPVSFFSTMPAYSAWYGKKFPVVLDVCVLCNILVFNEIHHLLMTGADSASVDVIVNTLGGNYHLTQAVSVSPYYLKTSVILYHVARLMQVKSIPSLEALKGQLIADAMTEFGHATTITEKAMIASSILKWGGVPPEFDLSSLKDVSCAERENEFSFFIGNMPSYFSKGLKKYATKREIGFYYHYCPAFQDVLLLEYLVLKNKRML